MFIAGVYMMATSPDARLSKHSRKAPFRGDIKDETVVED
jgi:hypothetical protein